MTRPTATDRQLAARKELSDRLLQTVLSISITNPVAELFTASLDNTWFQSVADAIREAAPEDAAAIAEMCFTNSVREAQRNASNAR